MINEFGVKKITFIGSGNLSTNLAGAFEKVGHQVIEVFSRNLEKATSLAGKLEACNATDSLDFSKSKAEVFIIAVSDRSISEVISKIQVPQNSLVLHTSGTTDLNVFDEISNSVQSGIFYPLQTFKKDILMDISEVPILVESKNESSKLDIKTLAISISNSVQFVNSADRKTIHLAAVFASNFTNRMLKASEKILASKEIPLELLKPLVLQSIENCFDSTPDDSLTGPANRGDMEILNQHKKMLDGNPKLKALYKLISDQILNL
jgi:predicted short-subunit dehydrogenase-like oxidoreductase (DUF2520 family)